MSERTRVTIRPFSLRHAKALATGGIAVELGERLRQRIWSTLLDHNETFYYSEPSDPGLSLQTSAIEESDATLGRLLGIDQYDSHDRRRPIDLHALVTTGMPESVFDLIEVYYAHTPETTRPAAQRALNDSLVDFVCPWRLSDGMLFRVDSEFLQEEVIERAIDLLKLSELAGAREEFLTARDRLTDGRRARCNRLCCAQCREYAEDGDRPSDRGCKGSISPLRR